MQETLDESIPWLQGCMASCAMKRGVLGMEVPGHCVET